MKTTCRSWWRTSSCVVWLLLASWNSVPSSLAKGGYSAAYAYAPDSDLLSTTTSKSGSTPVLTAAKKWEHGYRLKSIPNFAGSVPVSAHEYEYDALDRRTTARLSDGSLAGTRFFVQSELLYSLGLKTLTCSS